MALSQAEKLQRAKQAQSAFNRRGYGADAKERAREDREQRVAAGERGVILAPDDIKGDYDTNRALLTTLGGISRPITPQDLIVFKKNIETLQKTIKDRYKGGLTPQQIVDLSLPIDRERANKEIHYSLLYRHTLEDGLYHFVTNASGKYEATRHNVHIRFSVWGACVASPKTALQMAQLLVKSHIKFDCDCGRHKYWYRYMATVGNYYVGRPETGYPDERNANLQGVACKHILRTMNVLLQPSTITKLAKHIQEAREDILTKARHMTPKEMQQELKEQERRANNKKTEVRTSEQKARKKAVESSKKRPTKRQKELAELMSKLNALDRAGRARAKAATLALIQGAKELNKLGMINVKELNNELARHKATLEAIAKIDSEAEV